MTLLRPIIQLTSTEALQLDVGQVLLEIQGLQVAMNSGGEKLTKPFEKICGF